MSNSNSPLQPPAPIEPRTMYAQYVPNPLRMTSDPTNYPYSGNHNKGNLLPTGRPIQLPPLKYLANANGSTNPLSPAFLPQNLCELVDPHHIMKLVQDPELRILCPTFLSGAKCAQRPEAGGYCKLHHLDVQPRGYAFDHEKEKYYKAACPAHLEGRHCGLSDDPTHMSSCVHNQDKQWNDYETMWKAQRFMEREY
jgi:hypothetical protein